MNILIFITVSDSLTSACSQKFVKVSLMSTQFANLWLHIFTTNKSYALFRLDQVLIIETRL